VDNLDFLLKFIARGLAPTTLTLLPTLRAGGANVPPRLSSPAPCCAAPAPIFSSSGRGAESSSGDRPGTACGSLEKMSLDRSAAAPSCWSPSCRCPGVGATVFVIIASFPATLATLCGSCEGFFATRATNCVAMPVRL